MGTQFGKFQLLKKIAAGGMAEIHLAKQRGMEGFEKLVVIKMILPNLVGNQEFVQMFLDEARLAAKLNHPNIVQIFDMGKAGGTFFIAMEYIQGENLRSIVKTCRKAGRHLPVEHAVKIISQAAEGLYYAHTKTDVAGNPLNIVHRDISPQNIMVSYDGVVKVVDFGIAKAATQYQETRAGVLKGKYSYMSPEQCTGQPVDARSDIFALGIVLWELATGTRLYKQSSELMILKEITEGVVPPPRQINQQVPAELEAVILKALSKSTSTRFQDALQMHMALEEFLKNQKLTSSTVHLSAFMRGLFPDRLELLKKLEEVQASGDSLQSFLFDDVAFEEGSGTGGASTPSQPSRASSTPGSKPLYPRPTTGVSRVGPLPRGGTPQPALPPPGTSVGPAPQGDRRTRVLLVTVLAFMLLVLGGLGYLLWDRLGGGETVGPADADAGTVAPPTESGSIYVTSIPDGGEVAIDGNARGKTPCAVKDLPLGTYITLTVTRPGFRPWTTQFKIEDAKDQRQFNARLEAVGAVGKGTLEVVTEPPGASVSVDGRAAAGVTPLSVRDLDAGREHTLVASLRGRASWRQTFQLKPDEVLKLEGKLAPAAVTPPPPGAKKAVYSLRSSPSGAKFTLDGAPVGSTIQLDPGRTYALGAKLNGYEEWTDLVEPNSGEKRTITARLTRRGGEEPHPPPGDAKARLTLDSEPWAVVFLDGEKIGQTPLSDLVIPAGNHQVRLVNGELNASKTISIEAKPGQVIRQRVEFGKGTLVVKAKPWAHVFIGTRKLGTTPFEPKELYEGTYKVRLENPTVEDSITKTVTIKAGQQAVVEHDFLAGQN
ncbi:MAG TPA: serine/threonine-protein kinase [Myxococcota bacterium]|nr:serine/threonine-protein kinase [Myxococcota bacterium]HRY96313.1 serine/threonine-protein kinase [Myxococcota bacterium]HSA20805.1 serine/threonine-protein kinase [Myxococcota bacterium]